MARPASPPFTLGTINVRPHPTAAGKHQARGYYNDASGKRREVSASGTSRAAAQTALKVKVEAARTEHRGGDATLNQSTTVSEAAAIWYSWKLRQGLAKSTEYDYAGYVRRSIDGMPLGALTLTQANDVGRIEAWLAEIADGPGKQAAKQSRNVLNGVLSLAERRGAIAASVMHRVQTPKPTPGSNGDRRCTTEECDYDCGKRHLDTSRAFTPSEVSSIIRVAEEGKADVADLVAFLFGTGVRIAEALHHVHWSDVNLETGEVRIRGTKSDHADRKLTIARDLCERLQERAALHGSQGLVFGTTRYADKLGKPRDRNNVCKSIRRVYAKAGVQWAGTHTFRRTVATWLDESGAPLSEIANQLGHKDTNVTAQYLGRTGQPTRAASVMVLPTAESARLRAV